MILSNYKAASCPFSLFLSLAVYQIIKQPSELGLEKFPCRVWLLFESPGLPEGPVVMRWWSKCLLQAPQSCHPPIPQRGQPRAPPWALAEFIREILQTQGAGILSRPSVPHGDQPGQCRQSYQCMVALLHPSASLPEAGKGLEFCDTDLVLLSLLHPQIPIRSLWPTAPSQEPRYPHPPFLCAPIRAGILSDVGQPHLGQTGGACQHNWGVLVPSLHAQHDLDEFPRVPSILCSSGRFSIKPSSSSLPVHHLLSLRSLALLSSALLRIQLNSSHEVPLPCLCSFPPLLPGHSR